MTTWRVKIFRGTDNAEITREVFIAESREEANQVAAQIKKWFNENYPSYGHLLHTTEIFPQPTMGNMLDKYHC